MNSARREAGSREEIDRRGRQRRVSGRPDTERQLTVEDVLASVQADTLATALAAVTTAGERYRGARQALDEARIARDDAIRAAAAAGASIYGSFIDEA